MRGVHRPGEDGLQPTAEDVEQRTEGLPRTGGRRAGPWRGLRAERLSVEDFTQLALAAARPALRSFGGPEARGVHGKPIRMSFELTKSLLERLQDDVEEGRDSDILSVVSELHPADIGGVLDRLSPDEARYVLRLLEPETAAEAILELDEDVREKLLEGLTSQEMRRKVIENIESDDAALVMSELPETRPRRCWTCSRTPSRRMTSRNCSVTRTAPPAPSWARSS